MLKAETNYVPVKLKDKTVNVRKWKVKDRKKFLQSIKDQDVKASTTALVNDCMEDPTIPLSPEEFRYLLLKIRALSLGEKVTYELNCEKCEKDFDMAVNIRDISNPVFQENNIISSGNIKIKTGDIPSKQFYDKAMDELQDERDIFLIDFLFHIKEIDGSDAFTFEDLFNFINDLDIDIAADIFDQWSKNKFKIDDTHIVKCPHCNFEEVYVFEDIPGFFPDSWGV